MNAQSMSITYSFPEKNSLLLQLHESNLAKSTLLSDHALVEKIAEKFASSTLTYFQVEEKLNEIIVEVKPNLVSSTAEKVIQASLLHLVNRFGTIKNE